MEFLSVYIAGILLGIGLIIPIGPINLFVLGQGLQMGMPKALVTVIIVALNDTAMIVLGALGEPLRPQPSRRCGCRWLRWALRF